MVPGRVPVGLRSTLGGGRPDGTDQESVIAASPDFGSEYPEPSPTGDRLLYSHRHLVSPYTRDLRILESRFQGVADDLAHIRIILNNEYLFHE